MGIKLNPGAEGTVWAADGGGRTYDGLSEEHLTPNHPVATDYLWGLPEKTRLADEFTRLLGTNQIGAAVERVAQLLQAESELKTLLERSDQTNDR